MDRRSLLKGATALLAVPLLPPPSTPMGGTNVPDDVAAFYPEGRVVGGVIVNRGQTFYWTSPDTQARP